MVPPSPGIFMLKCQWWTNQLQIPTGNLAQVPCSLSRSKTLFGTELNQQALKNMQLVPENSVSWIIGIRGNSLASMPSHESWKAGTGIYQLCQLALWPMNSKGKMGPNSAWDYEQDDNDDKSNSQVTGIVELFFQQKKSNSALHSSSSPCFPFHASVDL